MNWEFVIVMNVLRQTNRQLLHNVEPLNIAFSFY